MSKKNMATIKKFANTRNANIKKIRDKVHEMCIYASVRGKYCWDLDYRLEEFESFLHKIMK